MSCEKVFIIAGEASGDLHGSSLVKELKRINPSLEIHAVGGERMERAGAHILVPYSDLSVVGLFEVFSHVMPILRAYKKVKNYLRENRPSLLILIDFPEFNLLMAQHAKDIGIPVFYYISPQIWAWRQGRVKKLRKLVDKMAVILPFEKEFYRSHGMEVEFVGHPLLDSVKATESREMFFKRHGFKGDKMLMSLLPGSRAGEIKHHIDLFIESSLLIARKRADTIFCLPLASSLKLDLVHLVKERAEAAVQRHGLKIHIVQDETYNAINASDLVIAASGTVTMEAAIFGVPMIVTYRVSPVSYYLGRRLIKVKWIGLVNIVAEKEVVPEILQREATPENLAKVALNIMEDERERKRILKGIRQAVARLGSPGAAKRVAFLISDILGKRH